MKLKYTLGALAVVSSLAGCSLDVNMYEGVTGESGRKYVRRRDG